MSNLLYMVSLKKGISPDSFEQVLREVVQEKLKGKFIVTDDWQVEFPGNNVPKYGYIGFSFTMDSKRKYHTKPNCGSFNRFLQSMVMENIAARFGCYLKVECDSQKYEPKPELFTTYVEHDHLELEGIITTPDKLAEFQQFHREFHEKMRKRTHPELLEFYG